MLFIQIRLKRSEKPYFISAGLGIGGVCRKTQIQRAMYYSARFTAWYTAPYAVAVVVVVVVVLTSTRIIKSMVTGQASVTLELRNTPVRGGGSNGTMIRQTSVQTHH